MNRRELLECTAYLIGGAALSPLARGFTEEQRAYLAAAPDYSAKTVNYFTDSQRKVISAMAESIIPRTDTPGAIDAGVPRFIELMASEWFNEQERAIFTAGLETMEREIPARYGKAFDQLSTKRQAEILEQMEDDASDSSWYNLGNVNREFVSDAPFFCQVKELTIYGFFTSEVGSKQVLRFEAMPMKFDGDVPYEPGTPSWATPI